VLLGECVVVVELEFDPSRPQVDELDAERGHHGLAVEAGADAPAEVGVGRIEVRMCRWQRWASGSLGGDDGDQLA
jgi:hypothetical protein